MASRDVSSCTTRRACQVHSPLPVPLEPLLQLEDLLAILHIVLPAATRFKPQHARISILDSSFRKKPERVKHALFVSRLASGSDLGQKRLSKLLCELLRPVHD